MRRHPKPTRAISRAISTILISRCDACSRKGENIVPRDAIRPVIHSHPELASSLPWVLLLHPRARLALSPRPFRRLLFSLQLILSSLRN